MASKRKNRVGFIGKPVFVKAGSKPLGFKLPDFELCHDGSGIFAAKILTLKTESGGHPESEGRLSVAENTIAIRKGRLYWISESRDRELESALEANAGQPISPERFAIKAVEEYSDILLDFFSDIEKNIDQQ
ncbi:MAG: hypothetical protein WC602_06100 [archaeon]